MLTVDLDIVEANARTIVGQCAAHGIAVVGVTKGLAGHPEVARAMVRAGVVAIGDSRLENLARLRAAGLGTPLLLLRVPSRSHASAVVELADMSCNTELSVLRALSAAAAARGRTHDVIVMVDLGDLREGLWPDQVPGVLEEVVGLPALRLRGLGANLTCFGGVLPTEENMGVLTRLADDAEARLGMPIEVVSGGNSSALPLIAAGRMPTRVNQVRIGEAILLGRETGERRPWPGTRQDACVLHGEVIELQRKPSVPCGPRGQDAMGHRPEFTDRGMVDHALVNLGTVDTDLGALCPLDDRLVVLGGSSDYLVLDATAAHGDLHVGDDVAFAVGYAALVTAATSPYVELRPQRGT